MGFDVNDKNEPPPRTSQPWIALVRLSAGFFTRDRGGDGIESSRRPCSGQQCTMSLWEILDDMKYFLCLWRLKEPSYLMEMMAMGGPLILNESCKL
jgi:hypothetical protein